MRVQVSRQAGVAPGIVRVVRTITARDRERVVWYEFPEDLEREIANSAEPWALLMLPLASRTGEAIELDQPLDRFSLENFRGFTATWAHGYADLREVPVRAPTRPAPRAHGKTAQFFSGGLDSRFTLLCHSESTALFPRIGNADDLDKAKSFDIDVYRRNKDRHLLIWNDNDHVRALEVRDLALSRNRHDIAGPIETGLRRSRRIRRSTQPLKKVRSRAFTGLCGRMADDMLGA